VWFARQLHVWDFGLIDCQVYTAHLERFGAKSMPRTQYIERVTKLGVREGKGARWDFDPGFDPLG
jgi:leucyl/phenylalanyl-tRNA--protein transferase